MTDLIYLHRDPPTRRPSEHMEIYICSLYEHGFKIEWLAEHYHYTRFTIRQILNKRCSNAQTIKKHLSARLASHR